MKTQKFHPLILIPVLWLLMAFVAIPHALAGTYRNDFENEADFLEDKAQGIWNFHVDSFTWEDGAIRGSGRGQLLMFGSVDWTDYTLEVKVQLQADSSGGIGLRFNEGPHYIFWVDEATDLVGVTEAASAGIDILGEESFTIEPGTWYSLKGVAAGNNLEFYINGERVIKVEHGDQSAGMAGICVLRGSILFEDFVLTGPDVPDSGRWTVTAVSPTKWAEIKASTMKAHLNRKLGR